MMNAKNLRIGILTTALSVFGAGTLQAGYVVAHRGESHLRPQNTTESMSLAWKNGIKYVEGDFHSTKGGDIVCVHVQHEFEEFYGIKKPIVSLTKEEVANAKLANKRWEKYNGLPLPKIEDIFKIQPKDGVLVLEIKDMDETFMQKVDAARKANNLPKSAIVFIAFNFNNLVAVKKFDKEYKCLWLYGLNEKNVKKDLSAEKVIKRVKAAGFEGVDVGGTKFIDEDYVQAFKQANLEFLVWTVDSDAEAKRLLEIGVDAITTNRATDMKKKLRLGK